MALIKTSPASKNNSFGLTLVEIMIAIALVAIISVSVLSTRKPSSTLAIDTDARRLASLMTECFQGAILRSRPVRIHFAAEKDQTKATLELGMPEQFTSFTEDKSLMPKPFIFSKGVQIEKIILPGAKEEEEITTILCLPQGSIQNATVLLKDATQSKFYVTAQPFTGIGRAHSGWPPSNK